MLGRFLLMFSIVAMSLFAHSDYTNPVISDVCEYAKTAIVKIDGDRIYLDPSKIFMEEGEIFLSSDYSEAIFVPCLFLSSSGPYVSSPQKIVPWWMCIACGCYHKEPPSVCRRCGKTEFVVHYFDET